MQPTTSPRHEPNTPEPLSDPQCTIPLSTLTTTGTANQPQHCDDGTIFPYPELRVHSGHTSMSVGTSTTTPNHFSLSTPKAIPFKQAPSTPHHTLPEFHIWTTYLWKRWNQWAWILCLSITAWRWRANNHHKYQFWSRRPSNLQFTNLLC